MENLNDSPVIHLEEVDSTLDELARRYRAQADLAPAPAVALK